MRLYLFVAVCLSIISKLDKELNVFIEFHCIQLLQQEYLLKSNSDPKTFPDLFCNKLPGGIQLTETEMEIPTLSSTMLKITKRIIVSGVKLS